MRSAASATDPLAYVRDMLQARVLGRLFAEATHGLVLKGGLAMRVLHDHARATKDIDLDADHSLPMHSIQAWMRRALKTAAVGLVTDVQITEPKQTDTTMRWKVAGRDPISNQVLHLTVEVSHRRDIAPEEVQVVTACNTAMFPKPIPVYQSPILALNKMTALLSPTRDAPRDVLDLYLLITAHVKPPIKELRTWIAQHDTHVVQQMWDKIESMDETRFRSEVLPSLTPCARSAEYEDWDRVRMTVAEHVAAWIAWAKTDGASDVHPDQSGTTEHRGGSCLL